MAEKKKDFFLVRWGKGIARTFKEVRHEMKRVIWPTKEKLAQIAVVVFAVILAAAIFLGLVGKGTGWVLEKANFYHQIEETTAATTAAETTAGDTTADTTAAS